MGRDVHDVSVVLFVSHLSLVYPDRGNDDGGDTDVEAVDCI